LYLIALEEYICYVGADLSRRLLYYLIIYGGKGQRFIFSKTGVSDRQRGKVLHSFQHVGVRGENFH
jgi:hypothetical protein